MLAMVKKLVEQYLLFTVIIAFQPHLRLTYFHIGEDNFTASFLKGENKKVRKNIGYVLFRKQFILFNLYLSYILF